MNTEKLLAYITNPQMLNQDSLPEIQKLVQLFPYSQNVQLLYLFNLSNIQDIRFGEQLQKTATYASDRRLLRKQVEELKTPRVFIPEKPVQQTKSVIEFGPKAESVVSDEVQESNKPQIIVEKENLEIQSVEIPVIPSSTLSEKLKYYKNQEAIPFEDLISERNRIQSKAVLLQLVKMRLAEIEVTKIKKPVEPDLEPIKTVENEEEHFQNKLDLIDKFIQNEPSISRPEKIAFFDPDIAAQESLFEEGAFVTETLAKIYMDQGNYRKAKEIYQVLSLTIPEKSSYFAALIQELENKLN